MNSKLVILILCLLAPLYAQTVNPPFNNTSIPSGGAVGGASNLTTAGAIPVVVSSGVLTQYASNLYYNNALSLLGLSTTGAAAPFEQVITTGTFSSVIDDTYALFYNRSGAILTQPIFNTSLEGDYGSCSPNKCLEQHWDYTSIDRGTSYRPFNWNLDLVTHNSSMTWNLGGSVIFADRGGTSKFTMNTSTGNGVNTGSWTANTSLITGVTTLNADGSISGVSGFAMDTGANILASSLKLTGSSASGHSWTLDNSPSSVNRALLVNSALSTTEANSAIIQDQNGNVNLNTPTGHTVKISINGVGTNYFTLSSTGYAFQNGDVAIDQKLSASQLTLSGNTGGGFGWILGNDPGSATHALIVNSNLALLPANAAIYQNSSGDTIISSPSGRTVALGIGGSVNYFSFSTGGGYVFQNANMNIYYGIIAVGTKFTASGCSNGTTVGGSFAGKFTSGTTGTCTVVLTLNGGTGVTAPNGWSCAASDLTTPANLISQTASSTTTCTISGTTVSGDVIAFHAIGY